jgi:hypothetical protein
MRMTQSAKVAGCRGHGQDSMGHATQKRQKDGKTVETPGMQQGPKGPRPEIAATRPRHKTSNKIFGEKIAKRVNF